MTTLLFVLGLLVLAVIGLGLGLWQLSRGSQSRSRRAAPKFVQPAGVHDYAPMARLFDARDPAFLKAQPGYRRGMAPRLRLERRTVLSLYLAEVHREFRRSWAYCRALAPVSNNAEFAPAAVRQFFAFYALYAALRFQCLLSLFVYVPMDVGGLLAVVRLLQRRARQSNTAETPDWTEIAVRSR